MKYSFPVSWYFLFLTKRSFYLVFNKAATIVLKRISSLHKVWWKYKYKFSVCILYPFCSLYFVPSLHLYPVCSLHFVLTGLVLLFLFERALSANRKLELEKNSSETILASMIDMWTLCWKAHEEKYSDRPMITLYQLKTNANARLLQFTVHNATSVYGIQLLSTVDNFRQHLLHHDTSFIAFSMNELKWW